MARRPLLLGFALALLVPFAACADPAAGDLLKRMATAAHSLDYEGTFIYEQNGQMQTVRIVHSAKGGVERERMITLSGPSREVIRDGKTVTCILGDKGSVVDATGHTRPATLSLSPDMARLGRNYEVNITGQDRVADREATRLSVRPKDAYRYGIDLWIDDGTGLLLKSELKDEQERVIEQLLFTSIKLYDQLPPELLKPQTPGEGVVLEPGGAATLTNKAEEGGWQASRLPEGFRQEMVRNHRMPGSGKQVEHRLFSDGLASVSVFIEPHDKGGDAFIGSSGMGAVNAFARPVDGHLVTVVGEVPAATVRLIGEGIIPAGEKKQ